MDHDEPLEDLCSFVEWLVKMQVAGHCREDYYKRKPNKEEEEEREEQASKVQPASIPAPKRQRLERVEDLPEEEQRKFEHNMEVATTVAQNLRILFDQVEDSQEKDLVKLRIAQEITNKLGVQTEIEQKDENIDAVSEPEKLGQSAAKTKGTFQDYKPLVTKVPELLKVEGRKDNEAELTNALEAG
ncbi:unnamed protein product, partial [Durusdinium trenchii]